MNVNVKCGVRQPAAAFFRASLRAAGGVSGDLLFERKGAHPRQQAALAGKRQQAAAVQGWGVW